jgi:hypothetical protein
LPLTLKIASFGNSWQRLQRFQHTLSLLSLVPWIYCKANWVVIGIRIWELAQTLLLWRVLSVSMEWEYEWYWRIYIIV